MEENIKITRAEYDEKITKLNNQITAKSRRGTEIITHLNILGRKVLEFEQMDVSIARAEAAPLFEEAKTLKAELEKLREERQIWINAYAIQQKESQAKRK